jgi:uncharacterized protein YecE (DUF72 family)
LPPHEKHRFPDRWLASRAVCGLFFSAVEINSSFYQAHRSETYARWAASVPAEFRFSVKFPKVITHERRLKNVRKTLTPFIESVTELGDKTWRFAAAVAAGVSNSSGGVRQRFFKLLRSMHMDTVVLEPRHATWFHAKAVDLCKAFRQILATWWADARRRSKSVPPAAGGQGNRTIALLFGCKRPRPSRPRYVFLSRP